MDKTAIIIGNVLCLCAMITDSFSGTRTKHSEIMAVQIVSQFFYAACSIVLKGYSSTVQNVVAVFRSGFFFCRFCFCHITPFRQCEMCIEKNEIRERLRTYAYRVRLFR